MDGFHFFSLDKNRQIYRHGWNFNMADIDYIFEHRVFCNTILLKYHENTGVIHTTPAVKIPTPTCKIV